ncbi:MAG: transposase [Actinomycetota bacterium]|nr:transposase [Actinomycetota bacterium]
MSIRQRLYATSEKKEILLKHCSDARFVYNLGLEQRNLWRRGRLARINTATQMRELAEARKTFDWLGEGSSVIQQAALRDLDRAFQNWWKRPDHFHSPTWRKAGQNEGFYIRDLSVRKLNRKWGELLVPKAGWVRFRLTKAFSEIEVSTSARVTLDRSGRWHVSFTQPAPVVERQSTGAVIGLDVGIVSTVTTSDGVHLRMPKLLSSGETQRKRRLQRKLSKQKKGSNRRTRTKHSIAKLSARECDRRKNWIEKTTTNLVRDYDFIAVEDLKVKNMVRSASGTKENPGKNVAQKRGLSRAISSQAWSLFRKRLEDKAAKATSSVLVVAVNPKHTSQTCPHCGNTQAQNRKSQAVFACITCGYTANADINAAQNILAAGLAVAGRRGTPHTKSAMTDHSGPVKRQPPSGLVA